MKSNVKNYIFYFFGAVFLILLCFLIQFEVGITKSGLVSFYGIEILGLCIGIYIIFYVIKHLRTLSKSNKILLLLTLVFSLYCLIDYAFRIFTKGLELKSVLIIESNLFVIGFMFIILFGKLNVKRAVNIICAFAFLLGIISVVLYFFIDYNISNIVLLNHATRTFLLGVLFPLTVYKFITDKNKFSALCFYIHLGTLVFCGLVSGARLNYVFIPLIIIAALILIAKNKMFSFKFVLASLLTPIIIVFISANFYLYIYTQLTRLPVTNFVLKTIGITYHGDSADSTENDLSDMIEKYKSGKLSEAEKQRLLEQIAIKSAELSAEQSTSIRAYAWEQSIKDIQKDPLFGIGLQQYSAVSSDSELTVPIQSHNFVLEYLLSFGLIGFILWAIMIFTPMFLAFRSIRFRFWKSTGAFCALMSLIFACAGAFFEPYFIFPCVMAFVYALIGCYYVLIKESVNRDIKAI